MNRNQSLSFVLMDAPFESAQTTTAMRLLDAALRRGIDVNVFAYEGAVYLPFEKQTQHANAVHGNDLEAEHHPLPRDWIAALMRLADSKGVGFEWINCGLCVDERGAAESIPGIRRGTPADLWAFATNSTNTLVIPTR